MSFILDALKKSERERQRQTSPALFEVKVAPPRNRFPIWAVVIAVLLVVNSGVIVWLMMHNAGKNEAAPQAGAAAPATPLPASPPPQMAGPPPPRSSGGAQYYGDPAGASDDRSQQYANDQPPPSAANDAYDPQLKERSSEDAALNPDDYEPARDAPRSQRSAARRPAPDRSEPDSEEDASARAAEKGLPSYQDAAAMPGMSMPELRLDLHVYDPEPDKSFVLVNMQKLKPGQTFAQGVHVDQITPHGAIMSYRGVRFVLKSE